MMKSLASFFVIMTLILSCNTGNGPLDSLAGEDAFSADSMKKHVAVLASDSFLGRKPFTEGEKLTVDYLQKQFTVAGLEPGNGNSFLQEVPMVNILAKAEPSMTVKTSSSTFKLNAFDDYIIWTDKTDEKITLDDAEVILPDMVL